MPVTVLVACRVASFGMLGGMLVACCDMPTP
jgi:hypothetical protein